MDVEEKEAIKDLFGEINYQGLAQLEGRYDTNRINDAMNSLHEVMGMLQELLDQMEHLKTGAKELIDGDPPDFAMPSYSVEECGNIGEFAMEICDSLSECSNMMDKMGEKIAPLQRLIPTEEGEVYIDYQDTLDENEEEENEHDPDENDDFFK